MISLSVDKKTGFKVLDPTSPVVILDENLMPFYDTSPILPVRHFNLPPGNYFLSKGELQKLAQPVSYELAILPPSDLSRFFYPDPTKFDIIYGSTEDKCHVNWDEKHILFDISCKSMPLYAQYFILFHEFGHRHYSSEILCDLYSANSMLKYGFTPFQIQQAKEVLSRRQKERKDFLDYTLLKNNGQTN